MHTNFQSKVSILSEMRNIEMFEIGRSTLGLPIYGFHIGPKNGDQILFDAGIHAREYITSFLLMELLRYYANKKISVGMYFLPCINPDGMRICTEGTAWISDPKKREFLKLVNNDSIDFSLWKANANAVDLNVNFDALWGMGLKNVFCLSPENFVGYFPFSERENLLIAEFVRKISPAACISYHSKGEVIFYGFEELCEEEKLRDFFLANEISKSTGYTPIKTEGSTGGFTDWVSLERRCPALTIEVGSDTLKHPIGMESLGEIFAKNIDVPLIVHNFIKEKRHQI